MRNKIVKISLYGIFLLLLIFPSVQWLTKVIKVAPLKGAVINAPKPKFDTNKWLSGEYQSGYEKFLNDHMGFRPLFVRIHNQIHFSFFSELKAQKVIQGKENYLYELPYIKSYIGENFITTRRIRQKVKQIKFLQDTLKKLNKTLFVVLAPGKGTFYPEYFPEKYYGQVSDSTNYNVFVKLFVDYNVNHIDMNKWFLEMKDTCSCKLYPKYGIHWSYYGELLAADSIFKYIENKRNIAMRHIQLKNMKTSSNLQYRDYDIGSALNLLFNLQGESMCYPDYQLTKDSACVKPKTVVISDSFYWGMFNQQFGKNVFSLGGFWYYHEKIFPGSFSIDEIDYRTKLLENDVIILMATETNIKDLGWGFNKRALKLFVDDNHPLLQPPPPTPAIIEKIDQIKNNPIWFAKIKKKAAKLNISIEEMLLNEADYAVMLQSRK